MNPVSERKRRRRQRYVRSTQQEQWGHHKDPDTNHGPTEVQ